jgi:ubiquinone/menaquinone biosynthesis C-methylase UbiE
MQQSIGSLLNSENALPAAGGGAPVGVPRYLEETYWWAYLHPAGVRLFERQWLVNLILWGNYAGLRDAALSEVNAAGAGRVLQVACVYGDFTQKLAQRLGPEGRLEVVDVAPVQIRNLRRKIGAVSNIRVHHQDSTALDFASGSFDCVVVFFLLHEQPACVRARTIAEAMRVVRPGGKVVFVDYHLPRRLNPFRYLMQPVLALLEPYAMSMWRGEIAGWLPAGARAATVAKKTYFGGLYQKVVITTRTG